MDENTSKSIPPDIDFFQRLTNVLPDAYLLVSPEGVVLAGNLSARQLFSCRELSAKALNALVADPPAKVGAALALWTASGSMVPRSLTLADGTILRCDGARLRGASPSPALLLRCVPKSESFATKQFVLYSMERVNLQKHVSEKLAAAQKRKDELETTAAVFAHELANPLNGVSTSLDLLSMELEGGCEKSTGTELIKAAKQEMARLAALVNDFRALARPQAFVFRPTDLKAVIDQVLAPELPGFKAAQIGFEANFAPSLPRVLADAPKLKQAVFNICKNAVEAMPGGGMLKITAGVRDDAVYLDISDTGVGIARNFNPFQIFKTTKATGTGLGLPIAAQIISVHKGRIEFKTEPGRGTTFTIYLPLNPA